MLRLRLCSLALLVMSACSETARDPISEARLALEDPVAVLGFENTSFWSVSQGTKSASTDRTQGSFSLGVANFTYTEIQSVPLSNSTGVTSTIAVDFKPPVSPAWGQAMLFASIPSRNIFNQSLGSVALAGSPAGSWRTLSFTVPANVLAALGQSYQDLRFKSRSTCRRSLSDIWSTTFASWAAAAARRRSCGST